MPAVAPGFSAARAAEGLPPGAAGALAFVSLPDGAAMRDASIGRICGKLQQPRCDASPVAAPIHALNGNIQALVTWLQNEKRRAVFTPFLIEASQEVW